ncbi:MAG: hypothetical protein SNJ61_06995, partial [Fimbriimonadaceae bacterium]
MSVPSENRARDRDPVAIGAAHRRFEDDGRRRAEPEPGRGVLETLFALAVAPLLRPSTRLTLGGLVVESGCLLASLYADVVFSFFGQTPPRPRVCPNGGYLTTTERGDGGRRPRADAKTCGCSAR